jgi:hypothetical protein
MGVVAMTALQHRRPDVSRLPARLVRSAWIAMALVPAGLAFGVVLSLLGGERPGGVAGALVLSLVSLAAPAAAVILAAQAVRAGQRSAKVALVVAGVLLVMAFAWLPLVIISTGSGWIIALAVVVAVLGLFAWRSHSHPSPPA